MFLCINFVQNCQFDPIPPNLTPHPPMIYIVGKLWNLAFIWRWAIVIWSILQVLWCPWLDEHMFLDPVLPFQDWTSNLIDLTLSFVAVCHCLNHWGKWWGSEGWTALRAEKGLPLVPDEFESKVASKWVSCYILHHLETKLMDEKLQKRVRLAES